MTNGERETSLMTDILSKTWSSKRLCRGAMSRELDHDRLLKANFSCTVGDVSSMPHSRHVHMFVVQFTLCQKQHFGEHLRNEEE